MAVLSAAARQLSVAPALPEVQQLPFVFVQSVMTDFPSLPRQKVPSETEMRQMGFSSEHELALFSRFQSEF